MYLRDLLRSCVRRWYVVLLCVVLSGGVLAAVATVVKPDYRASASIVMVPPKSTEGPVVNSYLGLGGLTESAEVLARSLTSDETTRDLERVAPPGSEYIVERDITTSAPFITVTATSSTAAGAQQLFDEVVRRVPQNLATLQDALDIEESSRITVQVISEDEAPEPVQKTRMRILVALAAALVLSSAVVVAAVDSLLLGRRARRTAASAESGEVVGEGGSDPAPAADGSHPSGSLPTHTPSAAPARAELDEVHPAGPTKAPPPQAAAGTTRRSPDPQGVVAVVERRTPPVDKPSTRLAGTGTSSKGSGSSGVGGG